MKYKKLKLSTIVLLGLGLARLQAQEAITAAGGEASGSGGAVSYSVGQVVYTTNTGANGSIAQGVQQPYEISVITGLEEAKGMELECAVYPNPATDFLTFKVKNYAHMNLSYQLFDMNGKLIENRKITSNETQINIGMLVPGTYFLKVFDNQKEIKTFQIIKN